MNKLTTILITLLLTLLTLVGDLTEEQKSVILKIGSANAFTEVEPKKTDASFNNDKQVTKPKTGYVVILEENDTYTTLRLQVVYVDLDSAIQLVETYLLNEFIGDTLFQKYLQSELAIQVAPGTYEVEFLQSGKGYSVYTIKYVE